VPAVGKRHLFARHDRHQHQRHRLRRHHHLASVQRQESRAYILTVAGAAAELPFAGQPIAAGDGFTRAIGKKLPTHGHAIAVRREHRVKSLLWQVGRSETGRGDIRNADPAQRAVLSRHFHPGVDQLGEAGFVPARHARIHELYQAAGPQRLDQRRGECAQVLRGAGFSQCNAFY